MAAATQKQATTGGAHSAAGFLAALHKALGTPYKWGGAGPGGFDCSGLVQWGLQSGAGMKNVPRTSEAQWAWTQHINKSQLRPGDLVFSQWPGDNASPGHVQVYIGGGKVIEAPHAGSNVHIASLSEDTGHIVGFGRPPGLSGGSPGGVSARVKGGSVGTNFSGVVTGGASQITGLMSEVGDLLHGIAEVLDWVFGFFAPGQGWRIAFGALAAASGYGAVKTYTSATGALGGGSQFPLTVGLAGVSSLSAFMALRPWPQEAAGPERPGEYLAEILSGHPPPPGPERVHETDTIEAGLAVFAAAWLASKASGAVSSIVGGLAGFVGG